MPFWNASSAARSSCVAGMEGLYEVIEFVRVLRADSMRSSWDWRMAFITETEQRVLRIRCKEGKIVNNS